MMCFRKQAYLSIGGHQKTGSAIADDLELARNIKSEGFRWRVIAIADRISCRMYHNGRDAWLGFVKNLLAAFDFRLLPFLFAFTWLMVMFWTPLVVLPLYWLGLAPQAIPGQLLLSISLSLLVWILPYSYLGLPPGLALLYPFTMLANTSAALVSLYGSLTGKLVWKGRKLKADRLKLI
jgi:chlorobactene glucosyltransferase